MKNLILLGIITISMTLLACKTKQTVTKLATDQVKYSLSMGPCFGKCPVFDMKIYEGGLVSYKGKNFTDKQGIYQKQLSTSEFKSLEQAFANSDFFSFQEDYKSMIPDLPLVRIMYNNGTQSMTSKGKEDRPEKLMDLQKLLLDIAQADGYKMIESPQEKPREQVKKTGMINEIIIEPADDLFMPAWIKDRSQYDVRLLKKVAPGMNYYLISFNPDKIAPKKFLEILRNDPDIKVAQFNKETSNRGK